MNLFVLYELKASSVVVISNTTIKKHKSKIIK